MSGNDTLKFLGIGLLLVIHAIQCTNESQSDEQSISSILPPAEDAKKNITDFRSNLSLCCPYGDRLMNGECVPVNATLRLPPLYSANDLKLIDGTPDPWRYFHLIVQKPGCQNGVYKQLSPDYNVEHLFQLLNDSTIYMFIIEVTLEDNLYCINGVIDSNISDVNYCFVPEDEIGGSKTYGLYISIPFLFATFFVYSVLPELKNLHGRTLRGYIGCLLVAYVMLATMQTVPPDDISDQSCYVLGTKCILCITLSMLSLTYHYQSRIFIVFCRIPSDRRPSFYC
ncbi:G-protein coupled receptor Mth2-like [Ceratina calcarata]|uniref:G-protein coupled receptor Mth2-like n=1 Tax=Ceratina calcarata TaxID=156304 RepID=A0AAJ7S767_9HYME|nr:G-protein coupled receptor Mth2-like [Ceratina calcarata]